MFRAGVLLRALPSILGELVSLVWYSYRTGDRRTAAAALIWLASTVALVSLSMNAVLTAVNGGEVQLRGPVIAAAIPIAMWVARELLSVLLMAIGWCLALFGRDPLVFTTEDTERI